MDSLGPRLRLLLSALVALSACAPDEPVDPHSALVAAARARGVAVRPSDSYLLERVLEPMPGDPAIYARDDRLLWTLRANLRPGPEPAPEPEPGADLERSSNGGRSGVDRLRGAWRIATDSHGFANPEVSVPSHPRVFRALCVGDEFSLPLGPGLDALDPFPVRLEDLLNARYPSGKIEVVNAAVPGHSTAQAIVALERWVPVLEPSLIVFAAGFHDVSPAPIGDRELLGVARGASTHAGGTRMGGGGSEDALRRAGDMAAQREAALALVLFVPSGVDSAMSSAARDLAASWDLAAASIEEHGVPTWGRGNRTEVTTSRRTDSAVGGFLLDPPHPRLHASLAESLADWVESLPEFQTYLRAIPD